MWISPVKPNLHTQVLAFLLLPLAVLACYSCTSGPEDRAEPQPVIYRLKWLYNATVAGDIWADNKGLFAARGLKVQIREGGPEQDAIKDLELGRAHFGVASADQVLRAAAKGAKVVVLAQIFQVNPLQWIYRAETGLIRGPNDLRGRRIGVTYGGNDEAILMALLRRHALSDRDLDLYAVHYDFRPFWRGEVDLWPVYRNTQGIILAKRLAEGGSRPAFFDPSDHGIRFVANSLITSRRIYEEHPAMVGRFTEAVLQGWREALAQENEVAVAETIHRFDPETPVAVIRQQLAVTRPLVSPANGSPIGSVDIAAWEQTAQILRDQDLLPHAVDVTHLLAEPLP